MIKVALVYDFDGTLAPGNMQEYGFLEALGYHQPKDFWLKSDYLARSQDAGGILTSQYLFVTEALKQGLKPTREFFHSFGDKVVLFPGVEDWFGRINAFARELGIEVQHFIDSSGIIEMIEGTRIAKEFTCIYACSYLYDDEGVACWPAVTVDYSTKVQFLSKISKGIRDVSDSRKVNEYMPASNRAIPMEHMIYLGDGETDVPSMRTVKAENGHAIAVYSNDVKQLMARQLLQDGRINFACPADYSEDSPIDKVVKHILEGIALRERSKNAIN